MKTYLKKIVPQSIRNKRYTLKRNRQMKSIIKNDQKRFSKNSFDLGKLNYPQMEARLTKEYHSIEKGLSYDNLRLGFGKQVLENTIGLMKQYRKQNFPLESHVYQTALS